ncbi:stage II sporulation protein R [Paenibacillus sp. oral taxon 786 str. D14]|uniref:stage II sporulation protein R n=1 Tax=Paenibacillus sp. oral taxon 786 TaxID=652715 RepID=UPI0001AFCF25|nr:stage II sporulation protein R [Paenibacillus sp. oral taxon 786]EES74727.1 stage II sporulation protein R [Paenibacillus sp. oral taxon 786 str. D14]
MGRRSFSRKKIALIFFSIVMLMMSWEGQMVDTAAAAGSQAVISQIPQESIRLRILANSDGAADQLVKRRVRDAVVEQMNGWVAQLENPQSLEEARQVIREHLPAIEEQVGQTLKQYGKNYDYQVELGTVPFPTKMYGGAVYPAGDYEALRVTLGEGKGKNWWCVLFPPLCFIDAGSGDALAKDAGTVTTATTKASAAGAAGDAVQVEPEETEVRFFLWDMLVKLWNWIASLFA